MTGIRFLSKVGIILVIFLWVGRCWTVAVGQPQKNNTLFASSSSSSASPILSSSSSQSPFDTDSTAVATSATTIATFAADGLSSTTKKPRVLLQQQQKKSNSSSRLPKNRNSERDLITKRIRMLPKDKLNRYKIEAARQLQASLIRSFQAIATTNQKLPGNVRAAARSALGACQAGIFNPAIERHLPSILLQGSQQQGLPAKQLQVILSTLYPHVPPGAQGSLQGLLGFVTSNLSVVNTLLSRALGTVPDLLTGVIRSLTNNIGAVTGALNGSVQSIGVLLGGVLG